LTAAARHGVLIKGGAYVEAARRLKAIALDKTDTLTYGRPEVQQVVPLNGHTDRQLLETAAALEVRSEHPFAQAILQKAATLEIEPPRAEGFQAVKGKGAHAWIDGRDYWIGSHRLMHDKAHETPLVHTKPEEFEARGHTVVPVGNDEHVCGLISIADTVRTDAKEAVRAMKQAGIRKVVMLTGDNAGTARAIAEETGVDDVRAELLPDDKVVAVRSLVDEFGGVAMAGDGINDAPALGAMGADVALETADVALMSDELGKIAWLIEHSRRTLSIIKQNMSFALGLKLFFIVLTLLGLASLWAAIAADTGATLLVTTNALRLLKIRAS
jgi:Cd2+/Zn2+-exporting ATPase